MFFLERGLCDQILCPYCGTGHDIEWTTEYGDPIPGDHVAHCINYKCEKDFVFHCSVVTTYRSRKPDGGTNA